MIMVPFVNSFSNQQENCFRGYGGVGCGVMSTLDGYEYCVLGSDLLVPIIKPMAEDDSRANSLHEEAATSSSKDGLHRRRSSEDNNNNKDDDNNNDNDHQSWLQLSIGGANKSSTEASCSNIIKNEEDQQVDLSGTERNLIELDLLPGRASSSSQQQGGRTNSTNIFHVPEFQPSIAAINSTSVFLQGNSSASAYNIPQHHQYQSPFYHQEIGWAYRHTMAPFNIASSSSFSSPSSSSPSSSSCLMPLGPYFSRPYHQQLLHHTPTTGIDVAGPSSDFRVIDQPRRPHSGIWFMLQASLNQAKEPFLPQISKSYLRIKDGKMTIRLLMKYLVNKLRLDSESEIEIRCRGEQLRPSLTLQHVRDKIWSGREEGVVTLLPHSSTSPHVMLLHYGRSA